MDGYRSRRDIHALPSLRYQKSTVKPLSITVPENPVTLGEHIRKKRVELGMSQASVGRLLEVSKDCVTYWENGRSEPQITYYPRIISFLGYFPFEIDTSTLQGRLKEYRYCQGLSYKKFGRLFGMDGVHVNKLEEGRVIPFKKTRRKLELILATKPPR